MTLLAIKDAKKNLFPNTELEKGAWVGTPAVINKGTQEQSLFRSMSKSIRLKAGTYTLSSNAGVTIGAGVQFFTTFANIVISSNATLPQTFTLTADADIYFHFRRSDSKAWDLSNNSNDLKIQLEKGSTVTPFETYQEMHPVPEVTPSPTKFPKKNVFNVNGGIMKNQTGKGSGSFGVNWKDYFTYSGTRISSDWLTPVKPYTQYSLSWLDNYSVAIGEVDNNGALRNDTGWLAKNTTFTTKGFTSHLVFVVRSNPDGANVSPSIINALKIQLEEGSTVTPFEEYQGVDASPTLYPKKNLFDKKSTPFELGSINSADGQSSTNNLLFVVRSKGYVPIKPNTRYTFNKILTDYNFVQPYCYDSNFNYVGRAPSFVFNGVSASFSTTVNTTYVRLQYNHISASYVISETERKIFDDKFQLEEGSTMTDFEPYTLSNLRSE